MTKEPQQSVAVCEQTLQQLEAKRAKLVERGAELPELVRPVTSALGAARVFRRARP